MSAAWPTTLWLVRHGESTGNLARIAAEEAAVATITIPGRDVDVPLSELGQRQSRALGAWFRAQPGTEQPTVVLSSPYVRAQETARLLVEAAALDRSCRVVSDERLREKEFGSLNRLTTAGIATTYPEEARRRAEIGKFYYRPPGGESWCDVILRLRSLLDYLQLRHAGERVLLVAHQVVVLCFRYLLEQLDEAQLLSIDRDGDVANCSITTFRAAPMGERPRFRLVNYNFVTPIENAGEPVTNVPDIAVKKRADAMARRQRSLRARCYGVGLCRVYIRSSAKKAAGMYWLSAAQRKCRALSYWRPWELYVRAPGGCRSQPPGRSQGTSP